MPARDLGSTSVPTLHVVLGAIAVALATASIVVVATTTDHDFESAAMIGMMLAVGSALYILIDRRMSRVEHGMHRVVSVDHDILTTLQQQRRGSHHLN